MSVSVPLITWISSLMGTATATSQSGSLTATVNLTAGWEIQIPIMISWKSGVSADAIVNVYASNDGGANYDSNPIISMPLARAGGGSARGTLKLPTGQYALQILNSGPSTGSAAILTAQVLTGILNQ